MAPRSTTLSSSFPPFIGFIRQLVLANVLVFFALLILHWVAPIAASFLAIHLALTPILTVQHGEIWQLITYSFINGSVLSLAFSMLSLWFIGSFLESTLGARFTRELYFISVLGAALTSIAISYTRVLKLSPEIPIAGASGGIFGIFVVFAVLFGDQEMILFPLPFRIKAKYLVAVYILIALAGLLGGSDLANLAHLGGALFGYLFVKFAPRRGIGFSATEWAYGLRNSYYRSKRRRAAKKFEVYMGKQGRTVRFDDEGKYIDPDKDPNDKKWMN